jgi:hypothetical protein
MRKSRKVPINLLSALAQFLTGRGNAEETCYCVDDQRQIVPGINCQNATLGISYHYIYGGSSEGHIGDLVVGGSTAPHVELGVSRRGFGLNGNGYTAGG